MEPPWQILYALSVRESRAVSKIRKRQNSPYSPPFSYSYLLLLNTTRPAWLCAWFSFFATPNQPTTATLCGDTAVDSCRRFRLGGGRRSRGHDPQDSRDHKYRRNIPPQVRAVLRIRQRLYSHDARVNHTRPHGEPDEAQVLERVAARDQQKAPQRRVDSDDHLQVMRQPVRLFHVPRPAGRPQDDERVEPDDKGQAH